MLKFNWNNLFKALQILHKKHGGFGETVMRVGNLRSGMGGGGRWGGLRACLLPFPHPRTVFTAPGPSPGSMLSGEGFHGGGAGDTKRRLSGARWRGVRALSRADVQPRR